MQKDAFRKAGDPWTPFTPPSHSKCLDLPINFNATITIHTSSSLIHPVEEVTW